MSALLLKLDRIFCCEKNFLDIQRDSYEGIIREETIYERDARRWTVQEAILRKDDESSKKKRREAIKPNINRTGAWHKHPWHVEHVILISVPQ